MRQSCVRSAMSASLACTLVLVLGGGASPAAQSGNDERTAPSVKPIPRMPDGRPDLTGVWWPGRDITPATSSAIGVKKMVGSLAPVRHTLP